jgi:hypothetical protein
MGRRSACGGGQDSQLGGCESLGIDGNRRLADDSEKGDYVEAPSVEIELVEREPHGEPCLPLGLPVSQQDIVSQC